MSAPRLRFAARGLVLDDHGRLLLCRFALPDGLGLWTAPGGGVEPGETMRAALRRELDEEIGLAVAGEPVHVWHQEVLDPRHVEGYDGAVNDYFLIRTAAFEPRGSLPDAALATESITGFRWWSVEELACNNSPDLFGPRALPRLLADLLRVGPPVSPLAIGL